MEKLCGMEVTSCQVSRLTSELDAEFELWRTRLLPEIAFIFLDATYIKVRLDGAVRDCAVFSAIGIRRSDGKRIALGVSAANSEAEPHWQPLSTRSRRVASVFRIGSPLMSTRVSKPP
jgi:transposase-like protein